MPHYAAFLGHQPHLSIAELCANIPDFKLQKILRNEVVLFGTEQELTDETLRHLGGTVAIAKRIAEGKTTDDLGSILRKEVTDVKGKVTFGLRTHGFATAPIRTWYRMLKEDLRKHGRPARYVGNERKPAVSVLLRDAGLLDGKHGCELVLISLPKETKGGKTQSKAETWIGRTVAAQDIQAYAHRDIGKPVRDTTVGLLPPKLAQILLNFGQWLACGNPKSQIPNPKKLVVWDPFCGTGVIPMECLLRGWTVFASDLSLKAVNGCTKNLDWLRKEENILKKDVASMVWKHDARKPFEESGDKAFPSKEKPDVIVTESSLGPALSARPSQKDVGHWVRELEELEADFLRAAAASFPGVPIVCTWPVWYHRKDQVQLTKIWDVLHELHYHAVLPPGVEPDQPPRVSLHYRRPDQFVGREIVLLRPRSK